MKDGVERIKKRTQKHIKPLSECSRTEKKGEEWTMLPMLSKHLISYTNNKTRIMKTRSKGKGGLKCARSCHVILCDSFLSGSSLSLSFRGVKKHCEAERKKC